MFLWEFFKDRYQNLNMMQAMFLLDVGSAEVLLASHEPFGRFLGNSKTCCRGSNFYPIRLGCPMRKGTAVMGWDYGLRMVTCVVGCLVAGFFSVCIFFLLLKTG